MICEECGKEFKSIGNHWQWNPSHRPSITDKNFEILKGIVMGDGCVRSRDSDRPRITINNFVTKEYLEYLTRIMPHIWGNITKCSDHGYRLSSKNHPKFSFFSSWYNGSQKVWPEMYISKNCLKNLYVTDGNIDRHRKSPVIRISAANQSDSYENFINSFSNIDIPKPSYSEPNFYWSVDDTERFFEYIGDPIPGFEYKNAKQLSTPEHNTHS